MDDIKTVPPSPAHTAYREALIEALRLHGALHPQEILAINAYLMGQFIAFQGKSWMTPDQATTLLNENIQRGNSDAISALMGAPKGTA